MEGHYGKFSTERIFSFGDALTFQIQLSSQVVFFCTPWQSQVGDLVEKRPLAMSPQQEASYMGWKGGGVPVTSAACGGGRTKLNELFVVINSSTQVFVDLNRIQMH